MDRSYRRTCRFARRAVPAISSLRQDWRSPCGCCKRSDSDSEAPRDGSHRGRRRKTFDTPQAAAEALVAAAEKNDTAALLEILGPDAKDLVDSGDAVKDKKDGVVYQKDLGPETAKLAQAITRYNPDKTWTITEDEP